jgi:hypothetical protein
MEATPEDKQVGGERLVCTSIGGCDCGWKTNENLNAQK